MAQKRPETEIFYRLIKSFYLLRSIAVSLIAAMFCCPAFGETILSASTEVMSKGAQIPSSGIINAILKSVDKDDRESFAECIAEKNIPKSSQAKLFRAVSLPRLTSAERLYFVRPALDPYCFTFYGAHLFRYWLVSEIENSKQKTYLVRYAGIADSFEVFPASSNGAYEIAETNCNANSCRTAWMRFNGSSYLPFRCSEKRISEAEESGEETIYDYPCQNP